MTTSDISTDPVLYALFERIVREARPASEYEIDRTGTRQNGSSFRYTERLNGTQKDQIPWGTHEAIRRVTWYPAGMPDIVTRVSYMLPEHMYVEVRADDWDHGIAVTTQVMGYAQNYSAGIQGTVRAMGRDKQLLAFASDDEVAARVLELIDAVYQDYVNEIQREAEDNELFDDYAYELRTDPLSEFAYPPHER